MSAEYYVIRRRSVPEILIKVSEVNKLLASGEAASVREATERIGISRSVYYKFRHDVSELHDDLVGKTMNLSIEVRDRPGVLSDILRILAESGGSILTIHQSVPIYDVAFISISLLIVEEQEARQENLIGELERLEGVHRVQVTGRQI